MHLLKIRVSELITAQKLMSVLESEGIKFTHRTLTDSNFSSLNHLSSYSEIMVETNEPNRLVELLNLVTINHAEYEIEKIVKREKDFWRPILIVYSVLISLLCLRYWYIDHSSLSSKNFVVKWNWSNTRMDYVDKKTGRLVTTFFDTNFDLNYEKVIDYYRGHGPVSVSYDSDEDGFYEMQDTYGRNGDLSGTYLDTDKDGLFDRYFTVLDNGDTLKFMDTDKDWLWEQKDWN